MLIEKNTTRMAKLQIGNMGYIETSITTAKPPLYQINDSNTLFCSIVHTYNADKTEPRKTHYQDMKQPKNSFEANHIDLYKKPMNNNTICNVQHSQKSAPELFYTYHK